MDDTLKRTPGDWRISKRKLISGQANFFIETDTDIIANITCDKKEPNDTETANMNLLSAAPELYRACTDVYAYLANAPELRAVTFVNVLTDKLARAILKANGKANLLNTTD